MSNVLAVLRYHLSERSRLLILNVSWREIVLASTRTATVSRHRSIAVIAGLPLWYKLGRRSKTDFLLSRAFIRIALMISSRAILEVLLKHYIVIVLRHVILEVVVSA
jgi:hypothetical protein